MHTEHEFTLVLDGISDLDRAVVDALFEAGCDDATITMQGDQVFMDFIRSAPTTGDAILSAIDDIHRAGISARVVRVDEVTPGPGSPENTVHVAGAINGALQASFMIEMDPTLRPIVVKLLDYAR